MKVRNLSCLLIAAALFCSCSDVKDFFSGKTGEGVITASMDNNVSTRVGFTIPDGNFYWSQNDKMGVTTSNALTQFTPFALASDPGLAVGTFKGDLFEDASVQGYAVYPYSDDHYLSTNGQLTYSFPATYTYDKVDADINSAEQGYGNSFNPAMWGKIQGTSVALKHLGGVFCIKFTPLPTGENLQVVLSSNKRMNGEFTANLNDESPVLVADDATDATQKKVTIVFSNSVENTSGVFYIPVPTGDYANVRLKILDGTKELRNIACGEYKVNRRSLKKLFVKEGTITATESTSVADATAASTALASGAKSIAVTNEVTDATIEIPAVSTPEEQVTLSLQNVANNATLTLDDNSGDGSSVENIVLSIPNVDDADVAPTVNVAMPNSTVTLSSNGGTATYKEVVAATADETIIVETGVTVKKLVVKKGNVVVKSGAAVESFERESSNTATVLVYAPSAISNLPTGFEYAGSVETASLKKAMKKGGAYSLSADADITKAGITVPAGVTATLDLNGHVLTAANTTAGRIAVYGSLTLKDSKNSGKIVANTDYSGKETGYPLLSAIGEDANITMQSGYIYAVRPNVASKGQYGVGVYQGGDFTMTGGKIEAGWYAVAGLGTDQTTNSVINIKGGELISTADYAMYLPQSGTTTITAGTVKGACGAIGQRSGTINVNGGTLIAEGTGSTGEWKDGTGATGNAVLSIACGKQNAYGDCTANINGGTLLAEGNAVTLDKATSPKHTLDIKVNGGTFSDADVIDYVAPNAKVSVKMGKDVVIKTGYILNATGATVSVDLNNHSIINKTTNSDKETSVFYVAAGTLNISGDGNVQCIGEDDVDGYRIAVWAYSNGVVNISGGSFYNKQKVNAQLDLIYVQDNGRINISGGTFESGCCNAKNEYWVLNQHDSDRTTSKINVTGGTFKNFNPANNASEGANTSFVASGYKVMCNGAVATAAYTGTEAKTYTVVKE